MKPGVSTQLLDSVKDLKYLKDMRLMETAFAGAGTDEYDCVCFFLLHHVVHFGSTAKH